MKKTTIALAISCLACSAFAGTRVDLAAVLSKDFIASPSFDQAAHALGAGTPFGGFGWEVVLDHIGVGGEYSVVFDQGAPSEWWLDWETQPIYASYHIFGPKFFIDPFVDAGMGCAGSICLGPSGQAGRGLALTLYPFVSAGAALELNGLRLGAKLSYDLGQSAIPVTDIAEYPLGRFQVMVFAGFSILR